MKHTVNEYTFENGLKGLVVSVPGTSVINIVIRFNSGYQFNDFDKFELPHVMEHMIGSGSEAYPKPQDWKIEIEKNGAYRNAYTNAEVNGYVVECAAFELERIYGLIEEWLVHPTFPEDAVATELSNVREELSRNTTQYGSQCFINNYAVSYPRHYMRYTDRIEQLDSITRDDIADYYEKTHRSDNMRFYVSGDFADGGAEVAGRIEQIAAKLERGSRLPILDIRAEQPKEAILQTEDIKQIYYTINFRNAGFGFEQRQAVRLMRSALFGGFRSRIFGQARDRGLAYDISGSTQLSEGEFSLEVSGYVTNANITPLFELVRDAVAGLATETLSEDELAAVKDLVIGSTTRHYQKASDMLGWYLGDYDEEERIYDFDAYLAKLRQTTAEEVREVARLLIHDADISLSMVGPVDAKKAKDLLTLIQKRNEH